MIAPAECDNLPLSREQPGRRQCVEVGLGPRVRKPDSLKVEASAQLLGEKTFLRGSRPNIHTDMLYGMCDSSDDLGVGVSIQGGRELARKIRVSA